MLVSDYLITYQDKKLVKGNSNSFSLPIDLDITSLEEEEEKVLNLFCLKIELNKSVFVVKISLRR